MGNALRWMLAKKYAQLTLSNQRPTPLRKHHPSPHPDVRYAPPLPRFIPAHSPLVARCSLRTDKLSSLTALTEALAALDTLCESVEGKYKDSLAARRYEMWQEKS
ncbi:hypothetical protein C0992_006839 [Termitomyces sp. T32_za158]|nr:hypothetical protein C0992_006839 [Termitomyces sp. T32_za158]